MMAGFQAEENLTGRASKKCAKNSGRYPETFPAQAENSEGVMGNLRSFKYEEAYLTQYNNIREARQAIRSYVKKYNFERCHSAIGGVPPAQAYFPAMLLDAARATA